MIVNPATARRTPIRSRQGISVWTSFCAPQCRRFALDSHLGGARTLVSSGVRPDDEGVSVEEISIGEFARRSRLSLKALRLYDELGVLVPSRVDEVSGYRYYDVTSSTRHGSS